MLFYHHVLSDVVGGKPLLATYCGMCRSGRVYDIDWPEGTPEFMCSVLFHLTPYYAIASPKAGGVKKQARRRKARQGDQLEDIYFEQMTLQKWRKASR